MRCALYLANIGIWKKAKRFVDLRRESLEFWCAKNVQDVFWFHVSSVGELEQARPVMESVRKRRPKQKIIVTYFSDSVPRLMKVWDFVDAAAYAPLDLSEDLEKFFAAVRPRVLVLNRYDLWPEMLAMAQKNQVPVALINASTPPLGIWGRLGILFRTFMFKQIGIWTYVDTAAATAWEPYVQSHARGQVTGNPRVDRVLERVEIARGKESPIGKALKNWIGESHAFVAGSTWMEDEEILLNAFLLVWKKFPQSKLIIVPHEPTSEHLDNLSNLCRRGNISSCIAEDAVLPNVPVCIVTTRGLLAELYALGQAAHVGGGFGKQVHSVIEPIGHGIPVSLGPRHERMPEVSTLIALGAAFVINDPRNSPDDLAKWIEIPFSGATSKFRDSIKFFVGVHKGAGERIADFLLESLNTR